MEAYEFFISDMLRAFVNLSPLQVLAGVAGMGVILSMLCRSRELLVVTLSALIYAVPFLLSLAGRG